MQDDYGALVKELSNALCRQDRFAKATAMLEEQRRWLKTHGGSGTDQVRLDAPPLGQRNRQAMLIQAVGIRAIRELSRRMRKLGHPNF